MAELSQTRLGLATAYGYAKSKGYTGTEEEFAQYLANAAGYSEQTIDAVTHNPIIQNGTWRVWDPVTEAYVDTGVNATGPKGDTGDPAPTSEVAPAVTSWMDEHITENPTVVIDSGLAVSGAAADAKKTGDEISNLKSALSENTQNLFDANRIVAYSSANIKVLDKISIEVSSKSAGTWIGARYDAEVDANNEYTIGVKGSINSGAPGVMVYTSHDAGETYDMNNPIVSFVDTEAGAYNRYNKKTFVPDTSYIRIVFFCTRGTSTNGNVDYKDIQLVKGNQIVFPVPQITATDFIARSGVKSLRNNISATEGILDDAMLSLGQINTTTGAESYSGTKCKTEFIPVIGLSAISLYLNSETSITLSVIEYAGNASPDTNAPLATTRYTSTDGFVQITISDLETKYIRIMFDAKYENIFGKYFLTADTIYTKKTSKAIEDINGIVNRLNGVKWYIGTLDSTSSSQTYGQVINNRGFYSSKIYATEGELITIDNLDDLRNVAGITYLAVIGYDSNDQGIFALFPYGSYRDRTFATTIIRKDVVYVRITYITDTSTNLSVLNYVPTLKITKFNEFSELKFKEKWNGVGELDISFFPDVACTYSNGLIHAPGSITSGLYLMPKSGLYTYTDPVEVGHSVLFYRIVDGVVTPADDYPYSFIGTAQENGYNFSAGYYPYSEGLYFRVVVIPSHVERLESLHIVAGEITGNSGRLPNLMPGLVLGKRDDNSSDKADHSLRIIPSRVWYWEGDKRWANELESINAMYVTVLRTRDVKGITIQPPYSAIARIYKIDHDNKIARIHDEIFGRVVWGNDADKLSRWVSGVPHINFSDYNFDGYAVVAILGPIDVVPSSTSTAKTMKQTGMGILRRYEDVMNSVYVEWENGVNVTIDGNIPSIARANINTIIRNTYAPDLKASLSDGGYGNWNAPVSAKANIPALGHVNGWFYSGSNVYNTVHMHVNPKSYITASKNRHSRVYVSTHPKSAKCANAYGSVCSSTSSMVAGLPGGNETFAIMSGQVDGFTAREYAGIESLRPGDFACVMNDVAHSSGVESGVFGHVVYITEVVKVNGEVYCVNAFNGTTPYVSFRTFVNFEALAGYTSETKEDEIPDEGLFDLHSSRYFESYDFAGAARLDATKYRTIRDAYGAYDTQDYPVSAIMCDRGTDSVYGGPAEYMTLAVTDGTTEIDLVVGGSTRHIVLTDYPSVEYSDAVVYDVSGMVQDVGHHEIKVNGVTMESFYVPPLRDPTHAIDGDVVTVAFEPPEQNDEPICVQASYYDPTESDPTPRTVIYNFIDTDTVYQDGKCHCEIDRQKTFIDGVTRNFYYAIVLRKTPYGTYYRGTTRPAYQYAGIALSMID